MNFFKSIPLFFIVSCTALSQNYLHLWTETGEKFHLQSNGKILNDSAQSYVNAGIFISDTCKLLIHFSNTKEQNIKILLLENGKKAHNKEFNYSLYLMRDYYVVRFNSIIEHNPDSTFLTIPPKQQIAIIFENEKNKNAKFDKLEENYPEPRKCPGPVPDTLLKRLIYQWRENHFEVNRLKDIKWFVSNNCLTVTQIIKIFNDFDYESSKLNLVYFSYKYLADKQNFLSLTPSMKFPSDRIEIQNFYNTQKK